MTYTSVMESSLPSGRNRSLQAHQAVCRLPFTYVNDIGYTLCSCQVSRS